MGCCGGLVLWSNLEVCLRSEKDGLVRRLKIKKTRSWGNGNEKALNVLESYVKRNGKNTVILEFSNSAAIENSHALKWFAKTQSNYIIQGCADDLYECFPFVE